MEKQLSQYQQLLAEILHHGQRVSTPQGVDALTIIGPKPMHYQLAEGFPAITERQLSDKIWQQAIAEIIAFINGARTIEELESYGCFWWKAWGTEAKAKKRGLETGDLGPGSYGAAFHDFQQLRAKHIISLPIFCNKCARGLICALTLSAPGCLNIPCGLKVAPKKWLSVLVMAGFTYELLIIN